jgi:hypothetical protein
MNDEGAFRKLCPITREVITFPEFIQSALPENSRAATVSCLQRFAILALDLAYPAAGRFSKDAR